RRFFGQRIGQVNPVAWRIHMPHIRQSKRTSLLSFSTGRIRRARISVEEEFSGADFIFVPGERHWLASPVTWHSSPVALRSSWLSGPRPPGIPVAIAENGRREWTC